VDVASFGGDDYRKTSLGLGLGTPQCFIFVNEDDYYCDHEQRDHCDADEVVEAIHTEEWQLQLLTAAEAVG
jgi:hypothetical protein